MRYRNQLYFFSLFIFSTVLAANRAGVINRALEYNKETGIIGGELGVFWKGQTILRLYEETGTAVRTINRCDVIPLKALFVQHPVGELDASRKVELIRLAPQGELLLDFYPLPEET
ncbi:MAG: hypothetical protein AB3N64_06610 [Puniceicoccaceae bacterium]